MVHDVVVIGAGIVGLATARAFARGGLRVIVVEAEDRVAAHQTGHNSGVIHSGIYYKPGSEKARTCSEGRELLYRYCAQRHVPHERCGKIIVATNARELASLDEIERRGRANGLQNLKRLNQEELADYEPHVRGVGGIWVSETGIVDYAAVSRAYAEDIAALGGVVQLNARFTALQRDGLEFVLQTTSGEVRAKHLVNCAGLQSDRVAKLCGVEPGVQIVPFRGEYYELIPQAQHLCKNLIYPVADPRLPFLGVHFTRMISGGIECGPNAVLAFSREGYRFRDVSFRDMKALMVSRSFWRMAAKFWKHGIGEMHRSLSPHAFWLALRELIPEVKFSDIVRAGAGVRAQALGPDGKLVDDFVFRSAERMIHVLNAPSPAATASLSIGNTIAQKAAHEFGLPWNAQPEL